MKTCNLALIVLVLACCRTVTIDKVAAADPDPLTDVSPNANDFVIRSVFKNADVSSGSGGQRAALSTSKFPAIEYAAITIYPSSGSRIFIHDDFMFTSRTILSVSDCLRIKCSSQQLHHLFTHGATFADDSPFDLQEPRDYGRTIQHDTMRFKSTTYSSSSNWDSVNAEWRSAASRLRRHSWYAFHARVRNNCPSYWS